MDNTQRTEDQQQLHVYKIVLLGDQGVGKTHLLNRYIKRQVPKNLTPTIGVEFANATVELREGGQIKAQIWDTAGQEKYRSITSAHYRRAVGALLVYDITREKSFESIVKWIDEVRQHCEPDVVLMLVGNKLDLADKNIQMRKVSRSVAENFAQQNDLLLEETSAHNDLAVQDVFQKLIETIYERKNQVRVQLTQIEDLDTTLNKTFTKTLILGDRPLVQTQQRQNVEQGGNGCGTCQ